MEQMEPGWLHISGGCCIYLVYYLVEDTWVGVLDVLDMHGDLQTHVRDERVMGK